jgi:hypothetical protein
VSCQILGKMRSSKARADLDKAKDVELLMRTFPALRVAYTDLRVRSILSLNSFLFSRCVRIFRNMYRAPRAHFPSTTRSLDRPTGTTEKGVFSHCVPILVWSG